MGHLGRKVEEEEAISACQKEEIFRVYVRRRRQRLTTCPGRNKREEGAREQSMDNFPFVIAMSTFSPLQLYRFFVSAGGGGILQAALQRNLEEPEFADTNCKRHMFWAILIYCSQPHLALLMGFDE